MRLSPFVIAATSLAFAIPCAAQNCATARTGLVPLTDLGIATYHGFPGGLYPDGANVPPPAHLAAGLAAAQAVQPLDASGAPSASGRIVLLSIGMSNATLEFSTWIAARGNDPLRNPAVTVVDGAFEGQDAVRIANPKAAYWTQVDQRIAQAGATRQQVQVVWLKEAVGGLTGSFPASAQYLEGLLGDIVRIAKSRFPNLSICYLTSRSYGGYATVPISPEPYAYESGFAVKWLIAAQIAGDPSLNFAASRGRVLAPWLAFGPYLWADGIAGRSDGLRWYCGDFLPDGLHPSANMRVRVADLLSTHFANDPTSVPWYGGTPGTRAAVLAYGAGCAGSAGALVPTAPSPPFLGNAAFTYGVEHARAHASGVLFWAAGPAQLFLQGCAFLVDLETVALAQPVQIDASGAFAQALPIPNEPGLLGAALYTQWLVLDPGAPGLASLGGAALSDGVMLRLGGQ